MKTIIVDSGPLIALALPGDRYHAWAMETARQLALPWHTSEMVVTEVSYFIADRGGDPVALLEDIRAGRLVVKLNLTMEIPHVIQIMHRYRDRHIDLADASIIRLSELELDCDVWTLDREDFSVYRRFGRREIPLIAPPK